VERVEGLATVDQWGRAYGEIVDFERSLGLEGTILIKFWIHVSEEEQLKRFEERRDDPLKAWKLTPDDWDLVQSVNLRGAYLLLRSAIPHMRRNNSGRAVLIGSINGSRGKFGTAAYSASKAGLIGMAKSVARETGRFGILVNVIEPGWVRTPLTEKVSQQIRDAALAESLVGSFLDPEDIASAVLYLCGPAGKRVTGQVLRVDGGQFLGPA